MKTPNILFQNCQELIRLYLTKGDTLNYAKEIKIAKKLLTFYPIEFFRQYSPPTKFYSLSVFLTKPVRKVLEREFSIYNLTKPTIPVKIEDKPVVELEKLENKPIRTIQEFVDQIL